MKRPTILLVNCSKNRDGNCGELLSSVAEELKKLEADTERFWIGADHITGCKFCHGCMETGRCVIDDRVNTFIEKATEADGFFIAAPQTRMTSNGSIDAMLERAFRAKLDAFRLKPYALVTLARRMSEDSGANRLSATIASAEMPMIGRKYWNLTGDGRDPRELFKNKSNVRELSSMVQNLLYFVRCIDVGCDAGLIRPSRAQTAFDPLDIFGTEK
ncbi:MAG: flavodoxin family protein [Clostridia bacterium]|nr:flavodoxin family protein [Clostridia bacterium]